MRDFNQHDAGVSVWRRGTRPVAAGLHAIRTARPSTLLVWVGLFTVSWDRFAQILVGSFNVKLPVVAFLVALVLLLPTAWRERAQLLSRPVVVLAIIGAALLLTLAIAAAFSQEPTQAALQLIAILLGAFTPLLATYLEVRLRGGLSAALTVFLSGAVVASAFGIYQLLAPLAGLHQGIVYEAVDSSGRGRISSFSYEAGYFGYFLILAIAALFALSALRGRKVPLGLLVFFGVILLLANTRAVVFTAPLLVLLLYIHWPRDTPRRRIWPALALMAAAAAGVAMLVPSLTGEVMMRVSSVFDPDEASSNAPRLESYDVAWRIGLDHLALGIGPGNLVNHYEDYGGRLLGEATSNSLIANNIWLQALLDGGIPALVLQAAFVAAAAWSLYGRGTAAGRFLAAGWLTVLVVAGAVASYFWDIELWAVLGLALAAGSATTPERSQTATVGRWGAER